MSNLRPPNLGALLRLAGVVSLLVAAVSGPIAAARAGSYEVDACNASIDGGANNSFVAQADAGMTAYTDCPAGQGMVARDVYDNGASPGFAGAWMIFDAPVGDSVSSIDFAAGWTRNDCNYTIGVVASNGDFGGNVIWGYPSGQDCGNNNISGNTDFYPTRFSEPVNASRVRIEARCGFVQACSRSGVSAMRLKEVAVHVEDDVAPTLGNERGALWTSDAWLAGTQSIGFDASDGSGIHDLTISVDGRQLRNTKNVCDYTQRAPCPQGTTDADVPTADFGADGAHTLQLAATDTAGNPVEVDRQVRIDNTPPRPPQSVNVVGGDAWRSTNSFDVNWTNPSDDGGAPISSVLYSLCSGTGSCVRGQADGNGISSIRGLQVPGAGDYALTLWLEDQAGNEDQRLAAAPVHLRFDNTSPDVTIRPVDGTDPTLVAADVSDTGSGLGSGEIDIQPRDATTWTPLPTTVTGQTLTARIDDQLPDGVYELRATATDLAGNAKTTQSRADGQAAEITLPLRLKTYLNVGAVRFSRGHSRLASRATVGYGKIVRVRGRITTPNGNPLQDAPIDVTSRPQGSAGTPVVIAHAMTTRTGRFSFVVRRGPSRVIEITYAGTPTIRPIQKIISLDVRGLSTIAVSRRVVSNGESVTFHGHLITQPAPPGGKIVALQVLIRNRWRTFATTRTHAHDRWHYEYRFDGTTLSQRYHFRVLLPHEAEYPYASGTSRQIAVRVRGN